MSLYKKLLLMTFGTTLVDVQTSVSEASVYSHHGHICITFQVNLQEYVTV